MLSRTSRLVLAATAGVLAQGAAQATVECPATLSGGRLTGLSVYLGDPKEGMDLAPDTQAARTGTVNVWELRSSAGVTAVCRYEGGRQQAYPLPAGMAGCRAEGSPRRTEASCR